jgi:hypothetical protein
VQPRTKNSASNIGTGTPIAHSTSQPTAPVSFSMIFEKIFIIPSQKSCRPRVVTYEFPKFFNAVAARSFLRKNRAAGDFAAVNDPGALPAPTRISPASTTEQKHH